MKHTQGKWEAIPAKDQDGTPTISIRGNAKFIATMDTFSIDGAPYGLDAEQEANARLIASAPELLEALESVGLWCDSRDGSAETDEHNLAVIGEIAQQAINKAKGN